MFQTELTQFNLLDSCVLPWNFQWIFNLGAWSAACESGASWGTWLFSFFNIKAPPHAKPRTGGSKADLPCACAAHLKPGDNYPLSAVGLELIPNYSRSYRQKSSLKKKPIKTTLLRQWDKYSNVGKGQICGYCAALILLCVHWNEWKAPGGRSKWSFN